MAKTKVKNKNKAKSRAKVSFRERFRGFSVKGVIGLFLTQIKRLRKIKPSKMLLAVAALWIAFFVSIGVIINYSAETSGTMVFRQEYEITFDHSPSFSEVEGLFEENNAEVRYTEVADGNVLIVQAVNSTPNGTRAVISEALSEREDVLSFTALLTQPVTPDVRFLENIVYGGGLATVGIAVYIGLFRRNNLGKAASDLARLYVNLGLAGTVLTAAGIVASKYTPLSYSYQTFNLLVIAVLVVLLLTLPRVYGNPKKK